MGKPKLELFAANRVLAGCEIFGVLVAVEDLWEAGNTDDGGGRSKLLERSGDEDSGGGGGGGVVIGGSSIESSIVDKPSRRPAVVSVSGVPIGPNLHHSQIRPMNDL